MEEVNEHVEQPMEEQTEQPVESQPAEEKSINEQAAESTKLNGTIKWFDGVKGYGFVKAEDGKDYFIHTSFLPEGMQLNEGDAVVFTPTQDENGRLQAKDLELQ